MKRNMVFNLGLATIISGMFLFPVSSVLAKPDHFAGGGKNFIQKLDTDGDGVVSQQEFLGPDGPFAKLDANGDGVIDESEAPKGHPHHGRRDANFIEKFDQDGDGKVSLAEFPTPEKRFSQMDKNGDGYIDQTEVASRTHCRRSARTKS